MYYGNSPSYDDDTPSDLPYNNNEAEPIHPGYYTTTWLPPSNSSSTPYGIENERELEAYAERATNRIWTWDEIHPAYRDHPADDPYADVTYTEATDEPPPEHWIQARPTQLLTTHLPIDNFLPVENYTEWSEPIMIHPPTDEGEYDEISDEYLAQVAQRIESVRRQMREWETEEVDDEVSEDLVSLPDPDNTSIHPCHSPNTPTLNTTLPLYPKDNPTMITTSSIPSGEYQVFLAQDKPLPIRHPPLSAQPRAFSRPNRSPPPRHRQTHPISPHSQTKTPQYAVKHRARFRRDKSSQTNLNDTPHHGLPVPQAKDPPQPPNLNSLRHVPSHLLQSTLEDVLRLADHLSRRANAEQRILKKTGKTPD